MPVRRERIQNSWRRNVFVPRAKVLDSRNIFILIYLLRRMKVEVLEKISSV